MTHKEEGYVLDALEGIQDAIRSPDFRQLVDEVGIETE